MNSAVLTAVLESPALPELIHEAMIVWEREQKLRQKFRADITPEHKWEFIQGQVVMYSPALNRHLLATQRLFKVLDAYVTTRRCGEVRVEKAMVVFPRNDYEPDVVFFGLAKSALLDADTLLFPIPDLIVEVLSPSTEATDRGIKYQDYALHGVTEYWIVDTVQETVEAHRVADGVYPPAPRQSSGMLASEAVPGFEIPIRAIFDEAENLATLRRILADT